MPDIPADIMEASKEAARLCANIVGRGTQFGIVESMSLAIARAILAEREAAVMRAADWFDGFITGPAREADFDDLARAIRGGK